MSVRPQDVKILREKTGAGMMDCKNALTEAGGDFEEAEKILKKQGLASMAKRSDRQTSEGSVFFAQNSQRLVMVELRCETDFVAMNEEFRLLGDAVAQQVLVQNLNSANENLTTQVQEAVLKLKENLNIGRIANIALSQGDTVASYSHNNGAIGTAVVLHCESGSPDAQALERLGRDLAMHAAAYSPLFLDSSEIDSKKIAQQEEIFMERAAHENIPGKARGGYVKGQIKKWLSECSFVDQGFVKEPKSSVAKVLQNFSKEQCAEVNLKAFRIVQVGMAG